MPIDFMGRRKRGASCDDELALVKAAAWAWYQHGSSNNGKPTREFDLAKTPRAPRLSRYKREAAAATNDPVPGAPSDPPSPAGAELPLLDGYEIERITKHLDRLISSTHDDGGGGGGCSTAYVAVGGQSRRARPGGGKGAAKASGFWRRHVLGMCGSEADVAEAGMLVPVAAGCRKRREALRRTNEEAPRHYSRNLGPIFGCTVPVQSFW